MATPSRLRGESALYGAATLFALVSLCVKFAASRYSGLFVSASRFAIGAFLCGLIIAIGKRRVRRQDLGLVLFRGLFGALSMIATYVAIGLTGPGRATLLSNTYPLFVGVFGSLFFREKLSRRTVGSVAVCTLGAALVMRDGSGAALSGDLFALAGSLLAGMAVNFVRRASSAGVDPFVLYLSPCLFGLPLFLFAPPPSGSGGTVGILLLVAVGGGALLAQALMASGYRTVPASKGSVVFYWETALTVLLGLLFAGERMNLRFVFGLCLILVGLWINRSPAEKPMQEADSTR